MRADAVADHGAITGASGRQQDGAALRDGDTRPGERLKLAKLEGHAQEGDARGALGIGNVGNAVGEAVVPMRISAPTSAGDVSSSPR